MADDPTILDDDELLRRLHPRWIVWSDPPKISSAAFQNARGFEKLSANLGSLMTQYAQTWQDLLAAMPDYGIASLSVSTARAHGQGIEKAPKPNDPSHVHVEGAKPKPVQRKLAKAATDNVLKWPDPPK